jgi:hypothetical protein
MQNADVLDEFVRALDPQSAATVVRLVEVISESPQTLDAAIKWRRLTFSSDGDFHHWLCGIGTTKHSVDLIFHFGGLLDDPEGKLVAGTSKFLRKMSFSSPEDIDPDVVGDFIGKALDRLPYFRDNWKAIQTGVPVDWQGGSNKRVNLTVRDHSIMSLRDHRIL